MTYFAARGDEDTISPVTTMGCVQLFPDEAKRLEKRINQFARESGLGTVVVDGAIDTTDASRLVDTLAYIFDTYQIDPKFPVNVTSLGQFVERYKGKRAGCSTDQMFVDDYFGDADQADTFHRIANAIAAGTVKRRPSSSSKTILFAGALALGGFLLFTRRKK